MHEFQDGDVKIHNQSPFRRVLHDYHRFKRRLLPCPNSPNLSKVPKGSSPDGVSGYPPAISSPSLWDSQFVAEMVAHIREESGIFIPYIDDFLLMGDSQEFVQTQLTRILDILGNLGWLVNREKSSLVPSQLRQFLGILIDTKAQRYFLPQQKIEAITPCILPLLANSEVLSGKPCLFWGCLQRPYQ